jgi:hypothetical protein
VTVWCHQEGVGFQVRALPATWILQKTSTVRSFRKNEANCVIVVPDCHGTQFRKATASQCVSLKKPISCRKHLSEQNQVSTWEIRPLLVND